VYIQALFPCVAVSSSLNAIRRSVHEIELFRGMPGIAEA